METVVDIDMNIIAEIAVKAGEAILEVYAQDFDVEHKDDASPLTIADKRANDVIIAGLKEQYPDIPIISEENKQITYEDRRDWDLFWLVDPLDGTKEFIKKNGEFTVNIALVKGQQPIAGVVHVPVQELTYVANAGKCLKLDAAGNSTTLLPPDKHYTEKDSILVVASRSHLSQEVEDFVEELREQGKEVEFLSAGSSLKFCLVAEGKADVYPRFGPTMEWDTGAAHAVALAAGRKVLQAETRIPLTYNKENLLNPWFIVE